MPKTSTIALVAAAAMFASALPAAPLFKDAADKERVMAVKAKQEEALKALQKEIDCNKVTYGIWNSGYCQLHAGYEKCGGDRIDEKGLEEMRARYLKLLEEREVLVETSTNDIPVQFSLRSKSVPFAFEYGQALMYKGDFAKAREKFEKTVAAFPNEATYEFAGLLFRLAECQYQMGDVETCKKTLKDLVSRNIRTVKRGMQNWSGNASSALAVLKGEIASMDREGLPRDNSAKAYPEPQKAEYTDKFASIKDMLIDLSGVSKDDARVKLLETRLNRLGVKYSYKGLLSFSSAPFTLKVELSKSAPVDRSEGYSLDIDGKGATVLARDRQGILWGLVSFMQLIDYSKCEVRQAKILDWPDSAHRGYLGGYWPNCAEFTVFNKMNSVDIQHTTVYNNHWSPLLTLCSETLAHQFRDLGLDLYSGICEYTMYPQLPFAWPESHDFCVEICSRYAKMGANVYFPFDDGRYPLCPPDKEKFGNGANCDAEYVSKIYRAVKAKYPNFKLIFCPPFYWGPDSKASYPEDRENYLKSLKEKLDPEIDLYWTGPMVKGISKFPYQTKWFTDLTGRKPYIFQNGTGPHNLVGYIVDSTDWNGWHYPGFFEEGIAGFHKNAHTPQECCQIATLADCLWNVKGYDMDRSAKRGVDQLLGDGMYDLLLPGMKALAYFDKYKYGELNVNVLHEDVADIEAKVLLASNCWHKAVARNPSVQKYGRYGDGVRWAANVVKGAKNPPNFMAKYKDSIELCRAQAAKEVGLDPSKGDIFLSPVDMGGGQMFVYTRPKMFTELDNGRFVKCLRGKSTPFASCSFKFECDPFPPSGAYEMCVSGLDDEMPALNTISIVLNGEVVYNGESGFDNSARYGIRKFTLPFDKLKRYNQVEIRNETTGYNSAGTPWLFINYVVLKKSL